MGKTRAVIAGMLHCPDCGEDKPVTEFYVRRPRGVVKQYHDTRCHPCRKIACVCRNQVLTRLEYERMMQQSGGLCQICRMPFTVPNFDHSHENGMLRGVLCRRCNTGLGVFVDDPELLDKAAEYLRLYGVVLDGKGPTKRDLQRKSRMAGIQRARNAPSKDKEAARKVDPLGILRLADKWAAKFTHDGTVYLFGYFLDVDTAAEAYRRGRERVLSGEIGPRSVFAVGHKREFAHGVNSAMRKRIRELTIFDPVPTLDERMKAQAFVKPDRNNGT